jgi:G3E family GTPase
MRRLPTLGGTVMTEPVTIPVFILTGFLGAGKSTLLNALVGTPGFSDSAIIVNEFGDVAIDHDLIRVGDRELTVTTTGCLCCTAGSDVRSSLFDLHEAARVGLAPGFARAIIETSGLGDPAPAINQIIPGGVPAIGYRDHAVARSFRLAGVVCAVDALTAGRALQDHFECLKQIAFADRIVLTKTDLAGGRPSGSGIAELQESLAALNPAAPIHDRHAADFDLTALFAPRPYVPAERGGDVEGWLALEQALAGALPDGDSGPKPGRHSPGRIRSVALVEERPIVARNLDIFFDLLKLTVGPGLLRLKGLVSLEGDPDRPVVLHAVQHVIHPIERLSAWPSDDRRTRMVAITYDVDPSVVQALFAAITGRSRRDKTRVALTGAGIVAASIIAIASLAAAVHAGAKAHSDAHTPARLESPLPTINE